MRRQPHTVTLCTLEEPASVQSVFSSQGAFKEGKGAIDVASAEQLVRRWHGIKSDAMGTEHDVEKLGDVLEGNLLRQWKDNAKHVEKNGW